MLLKTLDGQTLSVSYKIDCYVYDKIWLAFEKRVHELLVHISEEAEGFDNLMLAMNKAFPNFEP